MPEPLLIAPGESMLYEFDFSDELTAGVTLTSADASATGPMAATVEATDLPNAKAFVRVAGAVHGVRCDVTATGTLNNGDTVNQSVSYLGWKR